MSDLARRRARLAALIGDGRPLWRPQPFREARPPWCTQRPELTRALLALEDAAVAALAADDAALLGWLAPQVPQLAGLAEAIVLPAAPATPLREAGPHFDWAIPGRKRAQIEAFAAAVGVPAAPVVDACAGKGHLGRRLVAQWGVAVDSVEFDGALAGDGEALARRARQPLQRFGVADVLADGFAERLAGRHLVALHACGDLHRGLVRAAAKGGAAAIDIAPCCYDRTATEPLRPFSGDPGFALDRGDLRLAVTGTATAAPREDELRCRENAWKLGFMVLVSAPGGFAYRPLRSIPTPWLRGDFAGFCRRLAEREGLPLPAQPDWAGAEAAGRARWHDAERLTLLRLGYRRAIEVWLGLDLAVYLETAGYAVRLTEFCERTLTPRNLLLSARRRA